MQESGGGIENSRRRDPLSAKFQMPKPRIQSKLERLLTHQKQLLAGWLTTGGKDGLGISYDEAKKRIAAEFGIKTSNSALSHFYSRNRLFNPITPQATFDPKTNTLTVVIKLSR
jgi:hypothetical protein